MKTPCVRLSIEVFLSTLSLRRATEANFSGFYWWVISIHALLAESDIDTTKLLRMCHNFYPRSPCGERRSARPEIRRRDAISIHALLAESDRDKCYHPRASQEISIHALLAESDLNQSRTSGLKFLFLSTLSLRRATIRIDKCSRVAKYFYPRSPCGERQSAKVGVGAGWVISIHALLAESDELIACLNGLLLDFYPRSPCGERPDSLTDDVSSRRDFYPRSPCGERRCLRCCAISCITISIHALLAESDNARLDIRQHDAISIHALLAESDLHPKYPKEYH